MNTTEAHVIIEFRIKRHVWKQLRRKVVPEEYNWRIPADWLNEFDVLEGPWGVTPDTLPLQGTWQYKFNPHTYFLLNDALVREGKQ